MCLTSDTTPLVGMDLDVAGLVGMGRELLLLQTRFSEGLACAPLPWLRLDALAHATGTALRAAGAAAAAT